MADPERDSESGIPEVLNKLSHIGKLLSEVQQQAETIRSSTLKRVEWDNGRQHLPGEDLIRIATELQGQLDRLIEVAGAEMMDGGTGGARRELLHRVRTVDAGAASRLWPVRPSAPQR